MTENQTDTLDRLDSGRRRALRYLAGLGLLSSAGLPGVSLAQDYPTQPVRLMVGFAPGAATDAFARIVAQKLSATLGQQFIVENRPGAATRIAMDAVQKAAGDGYVLGFATAVTTAFPLLFDGLSFDPGHNFTPVAMLSNMPMVLVTSKASGIKTFDELIRMAKTARHPLTFGASGIGAPSTLLNELFQLQTGIEMNQIPYQGNAPSVMAILSGEITALFAATSGGVEDHIKTGKLNGLAIAATTRAPYLPHLKTLQEEGVDIRVDYWQMVLAPKGTPPPIINKLNREINSIIQLDRVQKYIRTMGMLPLGTASPDETKKRIVDEHRQWSELNKKASLRGN